MCFAFVEKLRVKVLDPAKATMGVWLGGIALV
jgi:hypothetical protein